MRLGNALLAVEEQDEEDDVSVDQHGPEAGEHYHLSFVLPQPWRRAADSWYLRISLSQRAMLMTSKEDMPSMTMGTRIPRSLELRINQIHRSNI